MTDSMIERVARAISNPEIWDEKLFARFDWMAKSRETALEQARPGMKPRRVMGDVNERAPRERRVRRQDEGL